MYDVCTYFFFKSLDNYSQPRFESHLPQFDQRGSYTSCPTGAKKFTNYVFCHPQFNGVIQNIENRCAILTSICLYQLLSK